jgi:hypothetical protein
MQNAVILEGNFFHQNLNYTIQIFKVNFILHLLKYMIVYEDND